MRNNKIKRQVLLELEVVEQLEKIAIEKFDAARHPVTKNPVITDALNLILKLGLKNYDPNYQDNNSQEKGNSITYKDFDSLKNQFNNLKNQLDLFTAMAASNKQYIFEIKEYLDLIKGYKSNYIRNFSQEDSLEDSLEDTKEDSLEDKISLSQEDTKEDIREYLP